MCGIVGTIESHAHPNWINDSIIAMKHRGPDSSGSLSVSDSIQMGAVRLAMTDPHTRSNQPMFDFDTGNVLTFNGEIFNFEKLKCELIELGHEFKTLSDTEVLLKWIGHFGISRISELDGMFAFAFYSASEKLIILGRDRLGKKPLYYKTSTSKKIIAWSSSISTLKDFDKVAKLDQMGLNSYFKLGYCVDPSTIYSDVFSLLPGEIIQISLTSETRTRIGARNFPRTKTTNDLRELVTKAVLKRVEGHKKVAISLSGGLDSAIIANILSEHGIATTCFSAKWVDTDKSKYNVDAEIAEKIAEKLGHDFVSVPMISTSELTLEIDEYLKAMQEPNNNASGVSMMKLYREIQKTNHRLVLTGDGADEVFAGYERHKKSIVIPTVLNSSLQNVAESFFIKSKNKTLRKILHTQISAASINSWLYWHQLFSASEMPTIHGIDNKLQENLMILSPQKWKAENPELLIQRDREIWLTQESNRRLDRVSMHYSLEARSPFQDDDLIQRGLEEMSTARYKKLNKDLLRQAFPEMGSLGVRSDKAGFISPIGHWLRGNSNLIEQSFLTLRENDLISRDYGNDVWSSLNTGNFQGITKLWSLVVLGRWLELSFSSVEGDLNG